MPSYCGAENWPQWRGPRGTSISHDHDLPLHWSEKNGVLWKADLSGEGASTPAIWEDAIFFTSQEDEKLWLFRLEKATGREVWRRQVGSARLKREGEKREQKFHKLHNMASPSPVVDEDIVIAHFGNGDLVAFDFAGQELWRHNLEQEHGQYTIWWGHANSPIQVGGLVISVCMQDSLVGVADTPVESYLVAHDLRTGELRWRTLRTTKADAEQCDSYTTPLLHRQGDHLELLIMGGNQLDAYDPETGKQLWFLPGLPGGRTVTGPTVGNGMVYATQGQKGPLVAVKLGGKGELNKRSIAWKYDQGTPDTCCPVLWGEWLFTVTDDGIVRGLDAISGHMKFKNRLPGEYKASPLAAEGRIYLFNTSGLCTVLAAGERFNKLAENQLDDEILASPAVSDGRLFIRGKRRLYCLGK